MFLTTLTSVGLCDVTAALVLIHEIPLCTVRGVCAITQCNVNKHYSNTQAQVWLVCPKSQCIASLLLGERDGLSMRSKDCLYFATVIPQHVSISRSLDCLGLFFIFFIFIFLKKCCLMTHILLLNYSNNLDSRLGQNCQ